MKNIVIYSGEMPDDLKEGIDKYISKLNSAYPDKISIAIMDKKYSYFSEIIVDAIKNHNADTMIYLAFTSLSDQHIGCAYINEENNDMDALAMSFSNTFDMADDEMKFDIVKQDTLYTKNDIKNNITIALNDSWYSSDKISTIQWAIYNAIFQLCDLKITREAPSQKSNKYYVRHNGKIILDHTNINVAINACDKKCNAVVTDIKGNIVHRSTMTKVSPTGKQSFINNGSNSPKKYTNPRVPTHIIKKTTGINKF